MRNSGLCQCKVVMCGLNKEKTHKYKYIYMELIRQHPHVVNATSSLVLIINLIYPISMSLVSILILIS